MRILLIDDSGSNSRVLTNREITESSSISLKTAKHH